MPETTKPLFMFGLMADCQYADHDNENAQVMGSDHVYHNRYRLTPGKLQEAVADFNQHELDFVIHLGDYTDRNIEESQVLDDIAVSLRAPLWHVLGNHEFVGMKGRLEEVVARRNMPASYYARRMSGFRLIVLDTNDLGVIEHEEGSDSWVRGNEILQSLRESEVLQAYDWNGGLGDEQMKWFENELRLAVRDNEKVIVFAHHPVFPPSSLNALNDAAIIELIERFVNVVAYINGHNHIGDYGERSGVPYLTVNAMVHDQDNAYGMAYVYADHMVVQGYGRLPSRTIKFPR